MERLTFVASAIMMATALLVPPASAAFSSSAYLAHRETTTLSGTVERIINEKEFMLRANHEVVMVNVTSATPPVLNEGDSITVTGVSGGREQALLVSMVLMNQRDNT